MTPTQPATVSGDSKITVRLLLALCTGIFIPMFALGIYGVRRLDGIEAQLVILSGEVSRNGSALEGHVTRGAFRSWLRESRLLGYPDLPELAR